MHEFSDIVLAFGESDEYSFVFKRSTQLYGAALSHCVLHEVPGRGCGTQSPVCLQPA